MKTADFKNQVATGNEKTAKAFKISYHVDMYRLYYTTMLGKHYNLHVFVAVVKSSVLFPGGELTPSILHNLCYVLCFDVNI